MNDTENKNKTAEKPRSTTANPKNHAYRTKEEFEKILKECFAQLFGGFDTTPPPQMATASYYGKSERGFARLDTSDI